MAEMTGAQAMYAMLVREGVRYVFGNPGTTELPLMEMFAERDEITYILALHEDSALGIAAGYADATGRPAVVNLHTNVGLAHALGNLYNAYRAGTPLIVTAGQQSTCSLIEEPLLCADMIELARQHTKWAWEVRSAAEIPRVLARAFKIAQTPPTGPVFLSLPVNFLQQRVETELPPVTRIGPRLRGDRMMIEKAALLLASAQNPAIIVGDGCARSDAVGEIVILAEALGARVHTEPTNSLLVFPTGHPLCDWPLFPSAEQTRPLLEDVDVLLIVGVSTLVPLVYTGTRMIPAGVRIIQIDVNDRELGKNYPAEIAIQADPRSAIQELLDALRPLMGDMTSTGVQRRRESTAARIADQQAKFLEQAFVTPPHDGPMSPAYIVREMRRAADGSAVLVDESVTATAYVRTIFELNEPNSYFYAKGGSLGLGLPAAIGVKLALPERQVICAVGDGSALYSIQALWTAAHYNAAVVFVVFNNAGYMVLKDRLALMQGASMRHGVFTGMKITAPEVDFVALAQSMGLVARRVSCGPELRPALDWALGQKGPALLDVATTRDQEASG